MAPCGGSRRDIGTSTQWAHGGFIVCTSLKALQHACGSGPCRSESNQPPPSKREDRACPGHTHLPQMILCCKNGKPEVRTSMAASGLSLAISLSISVSRLVLGVIQEQGIFRYRAATARTGLAAYPQYSQQKAMISGSKRFAYCVPSFISSPRLFPKFCEIWAPFETAPFLSDII